MRFGQLLGFFDDVIARVVTKMLTELASHSIGGQLELLDGVELVVGRAEIGLGHFACFGCAGRGLGGVFTGRHRGHLVRKLSAEADSAGW